MLEWFQLTGMNKAVFVIIPGYGFGLLRTPQSTWLNLLVVNLLVHLSGICGSLFGKIAITLNYNYLTYVSCDFPPTGCHDFR